MGASRCPKHSELAGVATGLAKLYEAMGRPAHAARAARAAAIRAPR